MDYETILENFQEDTSDKYATRMIEEGMNHPFDKVYEDAQIESINSIKDAFLRNKYSDLFKFTLETDISEEIPTIVPNIFPDELSDLGVLDPDNTLGDISDPSFNITPFIDSYEYKTKVEKLYNELQENKKDKSIIRKLIEMGWNPEVEPNEKNFKIARRNMITYIKHKLESIDIINLSKYDSDIGSVSLSETTYFDEEIHPVFVVCSYTYTNFGKLVRKITGATYSHASIGFDSGLQTLYSYNMNSNVKKHGGLSFESINEYIRVNKDAEIFVGVVFLDHYDYDKMRGNVNWYITNYHKSNYSIANLFRILVNKSKTKRYQMNMVCSQFVDNCFKLVNIDLTNKASNLTTPQDLSNSVDNKKVFILYDGLARDYDMKKIDKKIYSLINKIKMDAILKKNDVEAVLASATFQELEENSNYFRNLEIAPLSENGKINIIKNKESVDYNIKDSDGKVISKVKVYNYSKENFNWDLIADVQTKKQYRNRGLAKQILKRVNKEYSKSKTGLYLLVKKDNTVAINLYTSLGFKNIREYKSSYYIMTNTMSNKDQLMDINFSVNEEALLASTNLEELKENYVIPKKDLEYNLDDWKSGRKNLLIITGLSGSGKSTRASKLAKEYNAIHIEVDLFEMNHILYEEEQGDEGNIIVKEYFDKTYGGPHKFSVNGKGFMAEVQKFIQYCINYFNNHKDRLFILEGIQLLWLDKSMVDFICNKASIIVVNTIMLQSMFRAIKREGNPIAYFKSFETIRGFKEWLYWYIDMEKERNELIKNIKESVEIFNERVFPIIVSDEYITINTIEDMESQYQKAHKLLISYDKAGTYDKPMKSELAHLWFINACIESKLKKKKDQNLINLRSRVLNDFKKYLNKVMENDPTFDFTDYYTGSMYADNNIKIDKTLLKNLLSILKV